MLMPMVARVSVTHSVSSVRKSNRRPANKAMDFRFVSEQSSHVHQSTATMPGTECPGESVCTGMGAHCASSCDAETDCADGFHCWFEQGVCVPDGDVEVPWVECAPGDDTVCSDGQFCFEFRECVDVCAQDSDCQEGYGCEPERGVCRPLDDRICPPDQPVRCDNDDGSFFCISDGERCDGGLVCQVGEIECIDPNGYPFCHWGDECPPPGPQACSAPGTDDECDVGETCIAMHGECLYPCDSNEACASGVCDVNFGYCVDTSGEGMKEDATHRSLVPTALQSAWFMQSVDQSVRFE